jgi:hypothetical protein
MHVEVGPTCVKIQGVENVNPGWWFVLCFLVL